MECKKIFMKTKNRCSNASNNDDKNSNLCIPSNKVKKSCLKKKTPDINKKKLNIMMIRPKNSLSNKSVEFDVSSNKENNTNDKKYPLNDKLINDLKDICEEETDFSFCSTNEDNANKSNEFCIERNTFFEINSSYRNLNKITKGKYIKDINFQNKLKIILQNYYKYKANQRSEDNSNINDTLLVRTIAFSTELEQSKFNSTECKGEKYKSKSKYSSRHNNKSKENKKYNTVYATNKLNKKYKTTKIIDQIANRTEIKNKNSLFSKKNISMADIEIKDNIDAYPTYKLQNSNSEEQSSEKIDSGSVVVNKSNTSSNSKKSEKDESQSISNKDSLNINIKKDVNIFNNNNEIEYVIDKGNNNKKVNYTIYNKKKRKKKNLKIGKSKYNNQNNELLNQMLGIQIPDSNLMNNNIITTTSKMKDNKNDFNSVEKIKNIENLSIYNIIQKNINKNLNIIDNKEKATQENFGKSFCCII